MQRYINILRNQAIGGVIKYIKLNNITDALINLYDLDFQNKVVDKLEKIQQIIDIRQNSLNNQQDCVNNILSGVIWCNKNQKRNYQNDG